MQLFLFHLDLILHAGATIFFWNFESKQSLTYKIAYAVHLYLPLLQLAWRQIFWFTTIGPTAGNGLGQIQIELDFDTWILLDLDLIGYGYPFALNLIGLDYVGQTIRG